MALVDAGSCIASVLGRLKRTGIGGGVDIRPFKKDRSVLVRRLGDDEFEVLRDGFEQARYEELDSAKLRRLLKTLLKKEFPRSNKVHVTAVEPDSAEDAQ